MTQGRAVAGVRLRAVTEADADLLERWRYTAENDDPYDYFPDADPALRAEGSGGRMVVEEHGLAVGTVSWHSVLYGPNTGSAAWNIGISLRPEARGRGLGVQAQRMLTALLFATTPVNRVEASTDVENLREQRALEKAGFTREGIVREAQLREGSYHDLVGYSVLRRDFTAG